MTAQPFLSSWTSSKLHKNQIHIATAIWSLGQLLREVTPDLVELLRNIKHPTDAIIEERTAFFEKFGIQADSQLNQKWKKRLKVAYLLVFFMI